MLSEVASTSPTGLRASRVRRSSVDFLKGVASSYDVIVIGSGLGGLTAANVLGRAGKRVLLLEQHYNFGGLATWFKRRNGHIFDISLHGFPAGMIKTCRKYWSPEIAASIVRLRRIRFDNPEFSIDTTFDTDDFTRILTSRLDVAPASVTGFFAEVRGMDFYGDKSETTRQLFERHFPGRSDVHRLLMEPIAYANGSTLDDPAISYGIVFSNFMKSGVYIFRGGTDRLVHAMKQELERNRVELRNHAQVESILVENGRAIGVVANGKRISASAVVSNASLHATLTRLLDPKHAPADLLEGVRSVRVNTSSCQVYLGIRKGESIPFIAELLFTSTAPKFDSEALVALDCTSRTYSFYDPEIRPGSDRYAIVCSTNARYDDWAKMDEATYLAHKEALARDTIQILERYVPGVTSKIDHVEVATPRTFEYFTQHPLGASFGTKFEGLAVSQSVPKLVPGLFHAGSVGIIMSGWLGAANYGVIVANEVERYLLARKEAS
ncbi:MAG: NAD(P)/FAD-dependent oxidoreductase [Deltaproteobacteria bacterium]|nr:NAD(P)/FAD-dependent oxidoreductase [Deltaproteobacteria bacterium]